MSFAENSYGLTRVRPSSPKSSAIHFYQCVQHFPVSKQSYGCQCWGFLTCAQMLMHVITHGGCTETVRESALEAVSGRKIACRSGTRTCVSVACGFSIGRCTNCQTTVHYCRSGPFNCESDFYFLFNYNSDFHFVFNRESDFHLGFISESDFSFSF